MDVAAAVNAANSFSPSVLGAVVLIVGGAFFLVWKALGLVKLALSRKKDDL